ncbi:hypothetical protein SSX86_010288 [Deinandra increscens subsp. villosa]|uniref:Peptidase C1A papain C-terminal domain-containing protein n=1 Tax=Deinandra increscens subsp. villosa TaxID=3103831 RepID=A0AAP0CBB9_9ASTR
MVVTEAWSAVYTNSSMTMEYGNHAVTVDGKDYVKPNSEEEMMRNVARQPLSFAMDSSDPGFMFYKEGIYTGPCGTNLAHAMLLVGYDETPEGQKYWIVKNSWGTEWGEDGYIRMGRGDGNPQGVCGMYSGGAEYPLKSPDTKNIGIP